MNKVKRMILKNKIGLNVSIGTTFLLIPALISSCSLNNEKEQSVQNIVLKQYELFSNSKLRSSAENNLYKENFDWTQKNENEEIELSLNEILLFLNFNSTLSDSHKNLTEKFWAKINNQNQLELRYEIWDLTDNKLIIPNKTDLNNTKIIGNLLNFNEQQIKDFDDIFNKWKDFESKLKIKNKNSEILEKNKYKDILPTYLSIENFEDSLKEFENEINQILNKQENTWKINFILDQNDIDGIIKIKLEVINNKNYINMNFYTNNSILKNTIELNGFAKFNNRNEEIKTIYSTLGKSYNLVELNNNKKYPQLASSITNIDQLKQTLVEINKINDKLVLPDFFDDNKKNDLWYELKADINSSDSSGTLNAEFTIVDKFTKEEISPQNIVKIMTITNFISLVETINDKNDYLTINNVYKAYELFESINLKENIYENLPSLDNNLTNKFDESWLKDKTNNNIQWIENTEYFSVSSYSSELDLTRTNFNSGEQRINYFKINKIDTSNIINNDIAGVKQMPIILQIGILNNGELPKSNESWDSSKFTFIDVLPPIDKKISGNNISFNSKAAKIKYLKIGGYRTNDIDIANKIYAHVKVNSEWTFKVNEKIFFELINKKQSDLSSLLKTQIDEKIKSILLEVFKNEQNVNQKVDDILETFNFKIDLPTNSMKSEFDNNNNNNKITKLSTDTSEFQIISKQNENIVIDNYEKSNKLEIPKITIKIEQEST